MKTSGLSVTAFAILMFALIATLAMCAFSDGIKRVAWLNLESMAMACLGLLILGSILGWCAFQCALGKVSAILGTLVVAGFLVQFSRGSTCCARTQERLRKIIQDRVELPPAR